MASEDKAAVVRRVVEAIWNRGELAVADELFAPDYVNHNGLIPDLVRGPEAIKLSVALYRAAFPHLHIMVEEVRTDGEMVVLRWLAHNAAPGAAASRAARGPAGTVTGSTRTRVVGDQIAESWTDWDRVGVLRRLGLIPPPESG
jgi:predicted SnoaL-like aldol condensation-catalyzing enzyme